MNLIGLYTIFRKETDRMIRVYMQALLSPVVTTVLYFVVFGSAIGTHIAPINGVTYEQFIVPGLIMMALLTNALSAASSGIYFPKFLGTTYELLSAPLSFFEITLGYTLASVLRALLIGAIIFIVALFFTPVPVAHPFAAFFFAALTATAFSLFGIIIGIWADNFERLSLFPLLVITPLSFLGGVFYAVDMLPPFWQKIVLINPIIYMIDGLRYSFFGIADIDPFTSVALILVFLALCISALAWIFKTGYRLKN